MCMVTDSPLKVSVVHSQAPRQVREVSLVLPRGSTVAQAVVQSALIRDLTAVEADQLLVGIWGRKVALSALLRDQDRVELYRPLRVDPKVARRERFNRQGMKSAGLFAKRRAGAKAGY